MIKRILGIVLAVLLAAVGTLVLVAYVRTAETRALAGEETVEILVVDREVAQGTPVEAMAEAVRLERVPAKVRAEGSVADLTALSGQVAAVNLVPGEEVIATRFVEPETLGAVPVPSGLLEVTIELTPERAVGGKLQAGERVAVVASLQAITEEDEDGVAATDEVDTTHLVLHKVLVTRVQRQYTSNAQPGQEGAAAASDAAPTGTFLITLAVDAPSTETLIFAAEHGSVWLGREAEDTPEDGTRVVTRENVYR